MITKPGPDDIVLYELRFHHPLPLHGWVAIANYKQLFMDVSEAAAASRGCEWAKEKNVDCWIADVEGILTLVDCLRR